MLFLIAIYLSLGVKVRPLHPLRPWSSITRTYWSVEVILLMVVLLLCNCGTLNLLSLIYQSLQMIL